MKLGYIIMCADGRMVRDDLVADTHDPGRARVWPVTQEEAAHRFLRNYEVKPGENWYIRELHALPGKQRRASRSS